MTQPRKALFKGPTVPFDAGLADALGGKATAALALQQIHYLGLESPDGWVPISRDKLAAELGCTQKVVRGALELLRERGLIEARVQEKQTGIYRVNHDAVRDLQPHRKLGDWCQKGPDGLVPKGPDDAQREPEGSPAGAQRAPEGLQRGPDGLGPEGLEIPLPERDGDAPLSRAPARREEKRREEEGGGSSYVAVSFNPDLAPAADARVREGQEAGDVETDFSNDTSPEEDKQPAWVLAVFAEYPQLVGRDLARTASNPALGGEEEIRQRKAILVEQLKPQLGRYSFAYQRANATPDADLPTLPAFLDVAV